MKLAVSQPPTGTSREAWTSVVARIFARAHDLHASRRLFTRVFTDLYTGCAEDEYFTWDEFCTHLARIKVHPLSRQGGYREALLFAAEEFGREMGDALSFRASNYCERLQEDAACTVFDCSGLSEQSTVFLVSLIAEYIFRLRSVGSGSKRVVTFFLDDALGLTRASKFADAERGLPLADLALLTRSVRAGFAFFAQSYNGVSPTLRMNASTTVVCSATGDDAYEVARAFDLTREQADELRLLEPGQAVVLARSRFPYALRGFFPLMP
jgi:hypothetical protein